MANVAFRGRSDLYCFALWFFRLLCEAGIGVCTAEAQRAQRKSPKNSNSNKSSVNSLLLNKLKRFRNLRKSYGELKYSDWGMTRAKAPSSENLSVHLCVFAGDIPSFGFAALDPCLEYLFTGNPEEPVKKVAQ